MQIVPVPYDHPDVAHLNDLVQREYVERYGEPDDTKLQAHEFDPPSGLYLLAYDADGTPVASGGWRSQDQSDEGYADGDAELKRMYVVPAARGRGLARRILAALEADARAAGRTRMVLESGTEQPEALTLYASCAYVPHEPKFGLYRFHDESRCFVKPLG
ncbi:GNAT family N-acetyltransferase [Streptomyces buecherae]|uniref:GNAT family N-acetyltransferase n=1 Tax=Streptomyces buecherae TaxID=2763006 RepID=UPI00368612A6